MEEEECAGSGLEEGWAVKGGRGGGEEAGSFKDLSSGRNPG